MQNPQSYLVYMQSNTIPIPGNHNTSLCHISSINRSQAKRATPSPQNENKLDLLFPTGYTTNAAMNSPTVIPIAIWIML